MVSGRERGKTGKVLSIDLRAGKVVVEKLNIIRRHTKPNQKAKQGGILEREAPLQILAPLTLRRAAQLVHAASGQHRSSHPLGP